MSIWPQKPHNLSAAPSAVHVDNAALFYCSYPDCHYKSKEMGDVVRHEESHIPSVLRDNPCHICSKTFGPRVSFFHHMSNQHENNLWCPFCRFLAGNLAQFKGHVLAHSYTPRKSVKKIPKVRRVFLCEGCSTTFTLKGNLQRHQKKSCNSSNSFGIIQPETDLDNIQKSFEHSKQAPPSPNSQNLDGVKAPSTSHHSNFLHARPTFRCDTCSTSFTYERNLDRHKKNILCKPNPFMSSAEKFPAVYHNTNENSFENSKRTEGSRHGSKEQFHCSNCSKTFTLKRNLDRHQQKSCKANCVGKSGVRTQTTETPGATSQATQAQNKFHHEINPRPQAVNGAKRQAEGVQNGMKKVVGDQTRLFACQYCSFTTASVYNLRKHHRVHTGERPFKCPNVGCDYRARWAQNLQKHQRQSCRAAKMDKEAIIETGENLRRSGIECGNKIQVNANSSTAFTPMLQWGPSIVVPQGTAPIFSHYNQPPL